MINLEPATHETMLAIFGEVKQSSRAIVAIQDGEIIGGVGVRIDKYSGQQWMFMKLTDELIKNPKVIIRAWKIVKKWIELSPLPTRVFCDTSVENAEVFLLHFGFKELDKGVFEWRQ